MEKSTSSANRLVLKRILNQEGNNRCADCKTAAHPRWASWNIGVLICIRCSGVHRSLGTHISKVRSIDLDTWNDTQLEKLVAFGNTRANSYWESKLPPNYIPDEGKIPSFIKTKYELKRWVPEGDPPQIPPRIRTDVAPQSSVDLLDLHKPAPQSVSALRTPVPTVTQAAPAAQPANSAQKDRADVKKSILSLYSQPITPVQVQRPQPIQPQVQSQPSQDFDEDNFASVWK